MQGRKEGRKFNTVGDYEATGNFMTESVHIEDIERLTFGCNDETEMPLE